MVYNYDKLRGRIKEVFGTQEKFAAEMGFSMPTLSAKLNNKVDFKQSEIVLALNLLDIREEDCGKYFFCTMG